MKKLISLLLVLSLLLCGCAGKAEPTTEATTEATAEATTEATTEPATEAVTEEATEPATEEAKVYTNPLTGEVLDAPYTGRIFASTISNTEDAIPHVGAIHADILMEMYVSVGVVRCLGLFTNIAEVEAIGSTRSTRLIFNDVVQHYDAVLTHAGGSSTVLSDAEARGIDNFNIDSLDRQSDSLANETAYRDTEYGRFGEHNLFAYGPGILAYVESKGVRTTQPEDKDYYLTFVEDGTPAGGEAADEITITFGNQRKDTIMKYDDELGKYVYNQYGEVMRDQITDEVEAFENVIIMRAELSSEGIYQVADFVAGGEGYFACGGQIIPILWSCDDEDSPFRFTTLDGEPLELGVGHSYIAVVGATSPVSYGAAK